MISMGLIFQQTEKQEKPFYIIQKITDWYIRAKVRNRRIIDVFVLPHSNSVIVLVGSNYVSFLMSYSVFYFVKIKINYICNLDRINNF